MDPFSYFTVDNRPVRVERIRGANEGYVFDDRDGNMVPDPAILRALELTSGRDVTELALTRFEQVLAARRVELLHAWCTQLCTTPALDTPLAALVRESRAPRLPLSSEKVELRADSDGATRFAMQLPRGTFKRWQFEFTFGKGTAIEAEPGQPHRFRYDVLVPGNPYGCAVVLTTPADGPSRIDSEVVGLELRQVRGPAA